MWTWKQRLLLTGGVLGALSAFVTVVQRTERQEASGVILDIVIGAAVLSLIGLGVGAIVDAAGRRSAPRPPSDPAGPSRGATDSDHAQQGFAEGGSATRYSTLTWSTADVQEALADRGIEYFMERGNLVVSEQSEAFADAIVAELVGPLR